ncbi:hypothetical protein ACED29_07090 [Shewanella sp. 5S214]|uniref:hypothetical protein n=1 Tax=Shewanella sp. 5S214 TaxID=3229999 RepID=UPI00352F62D0
MSKDASLQKSFSALLNASFEQAKTESQVGKPFVLGSGFENNLFLPTINTTMKMLGVSNPLLTGIAASEDIYALPLDIKRSSRHKLTSTGVGFPSSKKFIAWLSKVLDQTFSAESVISESTMSEAFQVNSNANAWYSVINHSEDLCEASRGESMTQFKPLLRFLMARCEDDIVMQQQVNKTLLSKEFDNENLACRLSLQDTLWLTHSNLDNTVWLKFTALLIENATSKLKDKQQILEVAKYMVSLQLDFYLEAIAHYEVGCMLTMHADKSELTKPNGVLTRGLLFYANGKVKNCFDGFLHELKRAYTIKLGKVSWRQLARYIEIDEDENAASGYSLEEKQYARLKKWRNGDGAISNAKLQSFFVNLVGTEELDFLVMICSYARISLGLDKLLTQLKAQHKDKAFSDDDFDVVCRKVLAQYSSYYLRCIEAELSKTVQNEA